MWFGKLDISTLENWLWEAACSIRGPIEAPKYKDYIIPPFSTKDSAMCMRMKLKVGCTPNSYLEIAQGYHKGDT